MKTKQIQNNDKHYTIKPIPSVWAFLSIATMVLTILKIAGAAIPLWLIFVPLGLPIALCVALPVYVVLAILAVILVVLGLIILAIPPVIVLALVFGINEKIDDHNLGL